MFEHFIRRHNANNYSLTVDMYQRRIWVNPAGCTHMLAGLNISVNGTAVSPRMLSGLVYPGDWDLTIHDVFDNVKVQSCLAHWRDGVPWEQTGIYDHMLELIDIHGQVDGCTNLQEVIARYERLDEIFLSVKRRGRLLTRREMGETVSLDREPDGIFCHLGRKGPIFGGGGHHRLAMALALSLASVPAQVGLIHPEALGYLPELLSPSQKPLQAKPPTVERALPPIDVRPGRPWQLGGYQDSQLKFNLLQPMLDANSVSSVLDVGCNAGEITRLAGDAGYFAVGIDQKLDLRNIPNPLARACLGNFRVDNVLIDKLPRFDAVFLLSVHHQLIASYGDQWTRMFVNKLASKAEKIFAIEFAAINSKYGYEPGRLFQDNNENSVKEYAIAWLNDTLPEWHSEYVGKAPNGPAEPWRFVFVCHRRI